ncbi:ATP synthase F1 subunit delta [bacterium]|nr:ATP synthase F1 subunit delta [bacterium]
MENYISHTSKIYSQALFDADKNLSEGLTEILDITKKSDDLQKVMSNPTVSVSEKQDIIDKVFKDKSDDKIVSFLKILVSHNRFGDLEQIISSYMVKVNEYNGYQNVKITSAIELTDDEKNKIIDKVTKKLNKKIIPEWVVDKEIIAGLIFQIGDNVVDTSIGKNIKELSKI